MFALEQSRGNKEQPGRLLGYNREFQMGNTRSSGDEIDGLVL
jgi:hypothetical protein